MASEERRPSTFLRLTPDNTKKPTSAAEESKPAMTFLNLVPDKSSSYPQMPAPRRRSVEDRKSSIGSDDSSSLASPTTDEVAPRRKASAAQIPGEARILKLGPVHWGEHLAEDKDDFTYDGPSP